MAIRYDEYGGVGVIALGGDLRGEQAAQQYCSIVGHAVNAGTAKALVIDFTGTRFVDGRALEALVWSRAQLGEGSSPVHLAGLDANCHKIIEMTRLDDQFEVYPDVQTALKAVS